MVMGHTYSAAAPVKMVTNLSTNWDHDCLTSVINHEMLAPIYQGQTSETIEWYLIYMKVTLMIAVN